MCPHPQCMAFEWSKAFETIGIGRAHFETNSCGQFAKDGGTIYAFSFLAEEFDT